MAFIHTLSLADVVVGIELGPESVQKSTGKKVVAVVNGVVMAESVKKVF
jgi:hypothetical protein